MRKHSRGRANTRESPFDRRPPRVRRWIDYEQTVNDRLFNDKAVLAFDERSNTVRKKFYPEQRPVWEQEFVWLPNNVVRRYGLVDEALRAWGLRTRRGHTPLFLHPQTPAPHRRLAERYGSETVADSCVTPTASYRTVLAWDRHGETPPVLMKLSIGAIIATTRRSLRENQVARAVLISSLFETIPAFVRNRLGFDWFAEPCGMVETKSRHGWLLRRWPHFFQKASGGNLIPMFSLISRSGDQPPLLIRLARRSRKSPEQFLLDTIVAPFIRVIAYLLFEEGLQYEGHAQNVLWEIDQAENLTGRMILRDLADSSVNLAFRVAREKIIPKFPNGFVASGARFPVAGNAADYRTNAGRWRVLRGFDTVEGYGLWNFLWVLNQTMARFMSGYDSKFVEQRYLEIWQQAAIDSMRIRPLFRKKPRGIATDEAIAYFLSQVDWIGLGARRARLPETAEALLIEGRMRKKRGAVYYKLGCPWGDLFFCDNRPGFFRPAF